MMTDCKIKNGDIVLDNAGRPIRLEGLDALFQCAEICIKAKLGEFIYNRNLGSNVRKMDLSGGSDSDRLELVINEALARFENTYVKLISFTNISMLIELTIDGVKRTMEVQL